MVQLRRRVGRGTAKKRKALFVWTTVGEKKGAVRLAESIVGQRLAACANFFPVVSRYWWRGRMARAREWAIIFKIPAHRYRKLEDGIRRLHPYRLPAIVALPVETGLKAYLEWIHAETKES